jgi:glyceraldehyde 3-phosphate dehydrogenase
MPKNKTLRIAINGFGRIGRTTLKAGFDRPGIEFIAVNDITDTATLAHLLKHDSVYGGWDHEVSFDENNLIIDGKKIKALKVLEPAKLPWKDLNIDVVLECTGKFTDEAGASGHLKAGAKKVIVSAPAKGNVPTFVLGVNAEKYKGEKLINNASCTTNCIAPVTNVINESLGIAKAVMTTVHAYTADQRLVDAPHKDLRRARHAAANIVPTTTGAAIAVAEVIPEIKGLFDGLSIRVPVAVVSLADCVYVTKKKTTAKEVNEIFKKMAKEKKYKGILAVTEEPLVSSDFIKNPASAIVDLSLTKVVGGDLVKVIAWYDNEWGYSCRLIEIAEMIGNK